MWSANGQVAVGSRELCPAPAALLPQPVPQINAFGHPGSAGKNSSELYTTPIFPLDNEAKSHFFGEAQISTAYRYFREIQPCVGTHREGSVTEATA